MDGENSTEWYYAEGGQPQGPVDEAALHALAESGTITAATLVWNSQLPSWSPYGRVGVTGEASHLPEHPPLSKGGITAFGGSPADSPFEGGQRGMFPCAECGLATPLDEGIRIGDAFVCAACKSVFLQRLEQGLATPAPMRYAGFGARLCAKFIDGTLLYAAQYPFVFLAMLLSDSSLGMMNPLVWGISSLMGICFHIVYGTCMLGRYGSTVGKMALGLRVVQADGAPVTYGRALGRTLSEYISAILMNIGYIIAAFDGERRTLHDRICETRVIVE